MRSIVGPDLVVITGVWFEPSQFQESRVVVLDFGRRGLADLVELIRVDSKLHNELPRIGSPSPNADRVRCRVTEHRSMGQPYWIAIKGRRCFKKTVGKANQEQQRESKL